MVCDIVPTIIDEIFLSLNGNDTFMISMRCSFSNLKSNGRLVNDFSLLMEVLLGFYLGDCDS